MKKFNKNDVVVFCGKPSLFNKNKINLYEGQGILKKTYKLKLGDRFKVIEHYQDQLILKPIEIDIEDDYWFYREQSNIDVFELL